MTPPTYLAPLSVVKWTTSYEKLLSGSYCRVTYWLKMNLLADVGDTYVVIDWWLNSICILQGNFIFIAMAIMFKLYW